MKTEYPPKDFNCRDPVLYQQVLLSLDQLFAANRRALQRVIRFAETIYLGMQRIDPFVRQANQTICPGCNDVCCIGKHGYYVYEDLVYLSALDLKPAPPIFGRNDAERCPYLRETGCSIERPRRPSHCTWYFCDSLLDFMEPQPGYQEFDNTFRVLAENWLSMMEEFHKFSGLLGVQCKDAKTDHCHRGQAECRQVDAF